MADIHHFAFWSSVMDCWVVVHELPGKVLSVDMMGLPNEHAAKEEARRMNRERGNADRDLQADAKLRGRCW